MLLVTQVTSGVRQHSPPSHLGKSQVGSKAAFLPGANDQALSLCGKAGSGVGTYAPSIVLD